jgi:uncharacterized membrane protein YeiH
MSTPSFQVALWIELLAAGLGGLQGALFAAGERHRRIDVLGVVVIGLAVSLGGSLLRDVILSLPVSVLQIGTLYAVAAGAGAGTLILLTGFGTPALIAGLGCVVVTTSLRLFAIRFAWTFPEQRAAGLRRPKGPSAPQGPL